MNAHTSLVAAALGILAACSREDVFLLGPVDGTVSVDDAGAAEASVCGCLREHSGCAADDDCCSGICRAGSCTASSSCGLVGDACAARTDCCSGRCEPSSVGRVCTDVCAVDGLACSRASDCCGFACNAGRCGGARCGERNGECEVDADCCSNVCDLGRARCADVDTLACRATLESCTSGGGNPCCATCDEASGRCDLGPGPCRSAGEPCTAAADCCGGTCTNAPSGILVCGGGCLAPSDACERANDCCSGTCVGTPGVCATASVCE